VTVDLPAETFTLSNGLRVHVHRDDSVPVAAVNLWYRVGSKNERAGRTGFAHLFEHLMFEGSAHVPEGRFDELLEDVGGTNNGSTSADRTNYWETVPAHALELALYLEADRLGWLADAMTQEKLDGQRSVVINERRQSYENRPYGLADETLLAALYPSGHPYSWPVIGSMADLEAATLDDVLDFFRAYYSPGNVGLAIAGAVDPDHARTLVERWFGDIPAGPAAAAVEASDVPHDPDGQVVREKDVQRTRVWVAWHSPRIFTPGDAELDAAAHVLGEGKSSRLFRALVHERRVAQSVEAFQESGLLGSMFGVVVTALPGHSLDALAAAVRAEVASVARDGIARRELDRARNVIETGFVDGLETVGGFDGKADRLNMYDFYAGDPTWAERDHRRYVELTAEDVAAAVRSHLYDVPCVTLSVVPRGCGVLAAAAGGAGGR
jgi:zinc protease